MEINNDDLLNTMIDIYEKNEGRKPSDSEIDFMKQTLESLGPGGAMQEAMGKYYSYDAPNYGKMGKPICKELAFMHPDYDIVKHQDFTSYANSYQKLCDYLNTLSTEEQTETINNILVAHLAKWHSDDDDIYTFPVQAAVAAMEHFHLQGCLPMMLELLRQNLEFFESFFFFDNLDFMISGVIYHIIEKEDLPVLMKYMKTGGMIFYFKRYIALAVAHLAKEDASALPDIQQWLIDLIKFYAPIGEDTDMFDNDTLDTLIYCCIHTNNIAAKDDIIRLYSKYDIPYVMVKGGEKEFRKTIKKASLGTLCDETFPESGEQVFMRFLKTNDVVDEDEEDYDDENYDDEEDDGDEVFNLDDYDWQEYSPYSQISKAIYKPILASSMKKYTLRITLNSIKPEIWRELEVPSNINLTSLAAIIINAMGWQEDHLHHFRAKNTSYATSNYEISDLQYNEKDGSKYCIGELLRKVGDKTTFEYDYGDSWYHTVTLKAISEPDSKPKVALIDGKRACPPEDCGGFPGYYELCKAMKKPKSPDTQDLIEWLGSKYDPELFPLKKAQKIINSFNK